LGKGEELSIKFMRKKYWFSSLIIAIIFFGIFIRFWNLGNIPPGVHYDEAYNGIDALTANETGDYKIFYSDNTGREGFHINVIAFFINLLGNNNWGLRLANAIWGSLTVIGFFFLLKELRFSRLSMAIGTFMIATSFWHLVFSRTAYRAIMVPLILVWTFYFFWKAINVSFQKDSQEKGEKRKSLIYFAVSGLLLGLGFHTYIAFRVAPLILVILGISFVLTKKGFFARHKTSILVFVAASFLSALPLFLYFSSHFQEFLYRSSSVSVFNTPNTTFIQAFSKSIGNHLWAFFVSGDRNPRHNFNSQPLLPAAWSVLFAIGFIISVKEIGKKLFSSLKKEKGDAEDNQWFYVSVLSQATFWIMLLPGVLSAEGVPHSLRIIGAIPAVFILCTLPIEYIQSFWKNVKNNEIFQKKLWSNKFTTIFLGLIIMVIFGGFSQVFIYFYNWPKEVGTLGAYERKLFNLGLLVHDLPVHENNYLITAFNAFITSDRKQSSLKTTEYISYPKIKNYIFYRPMDGKSEISCIDPQLVFQESDQWLRDQYREKCPDLKAKRYNFDNGKYTFWVMSQNP